MIRRPPRSTPLYSSAASDVYKRQVTLCLHARRRAERIGRAARKEEHRPKESPEEKRRKEAGGSSHVRLLGGATGTSSPRKCWKTESARSVTQRDSSPMRSRATGRRSGRGLSSFQRARWSARAASRARDRARTGSLRDSGGRTDASASSIS